MIYEEQALFPIAEYSPEDSLAKTSVWPESVLDLQASEVECFGKSPGSFRISTPSGSSSKTYLVSCHQTEDETWEPSSGRWLTSGMGSATEFWTLSSSESPNVAVECSLSDVLETTGPHLQRYLLSAKACEGILRRATRRERQLPEALDKALRAVADQ